MPHDIKVLGLLRDISRKVSRSLDMANVAYVVLKSAKEFLNADYTALFLIDNETKKLVLISVEGFKRGYISNLKILASWESINNELMRKKRSIMVNDIIRDNKFKNKRVPFSNDNFPLGAFLAVPFTKGKKIVGSLIVCNDKKRKVSFTDDDKRLLYTLVNQVSMSVMNAKLYADLKELYLKTVSSLAAAIAARDPYTRGHTGRVSQYAVAIAKEMGADEAIMENVKLAGVLHDVGKIGIRDDVLLKDGALTDDEVKKMRLHPLIGSRIVKEVIRQSGVLKGIEEHHERIDGKGYPRGIGGHKISVEGRIISVADAYDTITTARPYKKAFTPKEAILEIVQNAGTQFDLKVVKAFQRSFSKEPGLWKVK